MGEREDRACAAIIDAIKASSKDTAERILSAMHTHGIYMDHEDQFADNLHSAIAACMDRHAQRSTGAIQ